MPEPTEPWEIDQWKAWLAERPPNVREIAEQFPPWPTYRLTTTDQVCAIEKYDEHDDGTVTVSIRTTMGGFIPIRVFGVDPHDLQRV